MSIENIIFESIDTPQETIKKIVLIYAGSSELSKQMKRLKVTYVKVERGAQTKYIVRGAKVGRIEVIL